MPGMVRQSIVKSSVSGPSPAFSAPSLKPNQALTVSGRLEPAAVKSFHDI